MCTKITSHRDRVNAAIRFLKPERTPRDFAAVPEIWQRLGEHFHINERHEILKKLDVDCRVVSYDSFCRPPDVDPGKVDEKASMERSSVGGMWRKIEPDGTSRDIWGAHRKRVKNPFGFLDQFASYPLQSASSLEDLKQYNWPASDWWNFDGLRAFIEGLNKTDVYSIRYRVGSVFETAWSLYGFEKFLLDMMLNPAMPRYILERITEVHVQNLQTVMNVAGDLIDIVYFYDDVASQQNLLISPDMYMQFLQPLHQQLIDVAVRFNKPAMMHSCGSVYPMIERFIDMGLAILNPIQPLAHQMQPEMLAETFGGRIAFHGGIDIQNLLPNASADEVRRNVEYTEKILGADGGYILSGSHHIQADTPIENILAMYGVSGGSR